MSVDATFNHSLSSAIAGAQVLELRVLVARPNAAELAVKFDAKLLINADELLDAAGLCAVSRCASRIDTAHDPIDLELLSMTTVVVPRPWCRGPSVG